jgi:hypothetical protein
LPGKIVEEHPKKSTLLTTPRNVLSEKKQIATTNNRCNSYYYGKKNRHDHMQACMTCQFMIQCNLFKLSGIGFRHTHMVQVVLLLGKFKY